MTSPRRHEIKPAQRTHASKCTKKKTTSVLRLQHRGPGRRNTDWRACANGVHRYLVAAVPNLHTGMQVAGARAVPQGYNEGMDAVVFQFAPCSRGFQTSKDRRPLPVLRTVPNPPEAKKQSRSGPRTKQPLSMVMVPVQGRHALSRTTQD